MKKLLFLIFIFTMLIVPTSCEIVGNSNEVVGIVINSADNIRTIKEGDTLQ